MMSKIQFVAMPTGTAQSFWSGAPDAHGQLPERHISDGSGNPCRHCLKDIDDGELFLIMAYRPFPDAQAYAETGPIFLHAQACARHDETAGMPAITLEREQFLLRGYGHDDRIVYGTGRIVPTVELESVATALLDRTDIAYLHLRSAGYNCFQCAIERAPMP